MRRSAVALLLLLATPAFAAKDVVSITLGKYRNVSSVGITAYVKGDADSSAVLRIFCGWTRQGIDTGMTMVRRNNPDVPGSTPQIYDGRILWMGKGDHPVPRTCFFYVEANDSGQITRTPIDTVSNRGIAGLVATGSIVYVSPTGDNSTGADLAHAKQTIAGGIALLKTKPDSGAFGGIMLGIGEYHERFNLDWGYDGKPRFFRGLSRDSSIVCGANEAVEGLKYDATNSLSWSLVTDSTYRCFFPKATGPADTCDWLVLNFGEQIPPKDGTGGIASDSLGEISGWVFLSDSLYVKRRSGLSPATGVSTIHFGYRSDLLQVRAPNWRVSNLTLRYAGGVGTGGVAAEAGFGVSASNVTFDSLTCYGNRGNTIDDGQGFIDGVHVHTADSCTVANSISDGLNVQSWLYQVSKARVPEQTGQMQILGCNSAMYNNNIHDGFNGAGFGTGSGPPFPYDTTTGTRLEVAYNRVSHTQDDALELDVASGCGSVYLGNRLVDTGSGFSVAPVTGIGPVFLFYNIVASPRYRGIKVGYSSARVIAYQNTFAGDGTKVGTHLGSFGIDNTSDGTAIPFESANNIWVGRDCNAIIYGTGASSFNYDVLDSMSTTRLVNWAGASYSLASLRTGALGWERNGYQASIPFADSTAARFDMRIAKRTDWFLGGKRISGVNTSMDGKLWTKAPSIGAALCPTCLND